MYISHIKKMPQTIHRSKILFAVNLKEKKNAKQQKLVSAKLDLDFESAWR